MLAMLAALPVGGQTLNRLPLTLHRGRPQCAIRQDGLGLIVKVIERGKRLVAFATTLDVVIGLRSVAANMATTDVK